MKNRQIISSVTSSRKQKQKTKCLGRTAFPTHLDDKWDSGTEQSTEWSCVPVEAMVMCSRQVKTRKMIQQEREGNIDATAS